MCNYCTVLVAVECEDGMKPSILAFGDALIKWLKKSETQSIGEIIKCFFEKPPVESPKDEM